MKSMVGQEATPIEIDPSIVGALELDTFHVPYVYLGDQPSVHSRLRVGETEYAYERSYPVRGHSAVMPAAMADLLAEGREVLVAERNERLYVYLA